MWNVQKRIEATGKIFWGGLTFFHNSSFFFTLTFNPRLKSAFWEKSLNSDTKSDLKSEKKVRPIFFFKGALITFHRVIIFRLLRLFKFHFQIYSMSDQQRNLKMSSVTLNNWIESMLLSWIKVAVSVKGTVWQQLFSFVNIMEKLGRKKITY